MKYGIWRTAMGKEQVSREEYEAVYSGRKPFLVLSEAKWEYEEGDFLGIHERDSDSPKGVGRSTYVRVTSIHRGVGVVSGYAVLGCEGVNIEASVDPACMARVENAANRPLIYLASPYTGDEQARFDAVTRAAGHLVKTGLIVFSPITHFHPIAMATALPTEWEFWERLDRAYLSVSSAVYVLTLPGWGTSKGVTAEIRIAREMGIPILFVDSENYSIRAEPHPPTPATEVEHIRLSSIVRAVETLSTPMQIHAPQEDDAGDIPARLVSAGWGWPTSPDERRELIAAGVPEDAIPLIRVFANGRTDVVAFADPYPPTTLAGTDADAPEELPK